MRRIGLDLGLRASHQAAIYDDATPVGATFRVQRTRESVDELVAKASDGVDGSVEFVMEPTGLAWLPLAADLVRMGHRAYLPKPHKTKALRKFFSQHAKSDRGDAAVAARIRLVDPDGVCPLRIPSPARTMLKLSLKQRSRRVEDGTRARLRVQGWLELANPHLFAAFGGSLFTKPAMALLRDYLDPERVKRLGRARLHRLLNKHSRCGVSERRVDKIWEACETQRRWYEPMRQAGALPFDYEVLQEMVGRELDHIDFLSEQVREIERTIGRLYETLDPERVLEQQVPGLGPTIAPAIEAWVGDVERFRSVSRFAAYSGLVPRSSQTGVGDGTNSQRMTKGGPSILKHYLFLAAETARRKDPDLAAAYARATGNGHHHYSAVVVVAHKLLRKIYAVLKQRAAARRAQAEGRVAPVEYRYNHPETGVRLTKKEASAYVTQHFPSTATLRRRRGQEAADTSRYSGSLESATSGKRAEPPRADVAESRRSEKPVENSRPPSAHGGAIPC